MMGKGRLTADSRDLLQLLTSSKTTPRGWSRR